MTWQIGKMWVAAAVGCALCVPVAAQQAEIGSAEPPRTSVMLFAQAPGGAAEGRGVAVKPVRPGFNGLYPGMRVAELPSTLTRTGNIGELEGFVGPDYIQAQFSGDAVTQIAVIYYSASSRSMPIVDRKLSLADAWRIHAVGEDVPEFALYMAYLQKVEGLIDARNLIAYKLKFPKEEFSRNAPALFHPQTRVERVVYVKDRVELAFNYQPIGSRELLKTIAERYREALAK